jgi:hypothetical protein
MTRINRLFVHSANALLAARLTYKARRLTVVCIVSLLCLPQIVGASDIDAINDLISKHTKAEIIPILINKCGGEITVSQPPNTTVFGRPRAELVNADTIAADLKRCKLTLLSLESAANDKARRPLPADKIHRNAGSSSSPNSSSSMAPPLRTPNTSGLRPAERAKLRQIKAKQEAKKRRKKYLRRREQLKQSYAKEDADFAASQQKKACERARRAVVSANDLRNRMRSLSARRRATDAYNKARKNKRESC